MKEYQTTILVVDDEVNNLRLLQLDLEDAGYSVLSAKDGIEAIATLKENSYVQLILLDRMMPNMDGMEVLKIVKKNPEWAKIPVIMQTAYSETPQVVEGLNAGVYYYLAKPFDSEIMLAIVKTAINEYSGHLKLHEEIRRFQKVVSLFDRASITVRHPREVEYIVPFLANMFPEPDQVIVGISELIVNAIEHGNLGIGYEQKRQLIIKGTLKQEIETRAMLEENRNKYVKIDFDKQDNNYILTVEDQGNGFDWHKYLNFTVERANDPNGRGLLVVKNSFHKVEYLGKGNKAVCYYTVHNT